MGQAPTIFEGDARAALTLLSYDELAGFEDDDHLEAFACWRRSAGAIIEGLAPTRPGVATPTGLQKAARAALALKIETRREARAFFIAHFRPFRVSPDDGRGAGFVTGYYEPLIKGAFAPWSEFSAPVLGRPADLNSLQPHHDRAAIELAAASGETTPILWLEDHVELFLAQVQGAARVALPDGRQIRLAYDGRNSRPYTSIGRLLIDQGEIAAKDMSLAALKSWLRANGQKPGDKGRDLMQRNRSYVFFRIEERFDPADGPTGGEGIALTPLRSIAVDRAVWPYGAPFFLNANLPWRGAGPSPFRRLMIAQDTGSAILGRARADIFFGSGDEAGRRAGDIRHDADFAALLPRETPP
ncbi:MAG TPA: MltA domain-containing protein [Roseiarcus sp.]|nr:MltA domain-containing protein [Roseiarcus sp.]